MKTVMKVDAENITAPNVMAPTFFPLTLQFKKTANIEHSTFIEKYNALFSLKNLTLCCGGLLCFNCKTSPSKNTSVV